MRRRGFTSTQYVVVLVVLFFAAPMLFIMVAFRGGGPSNVMLCKSNLRQLGTAFLMYAQDYENRCPMMAGVPASSAAQLEERYGWGDAIFPYVKTSQRYQCPAEKVQENKEYKPWQPGYTDYYFNSRLDRRTLASIDDPAYLILMGEGNDGLDVNDARYAHDSVPPMWLTAEKSPAQRHNRDAGNYLFADGHVKALRTREAPKIKASKSAQPSFSP